MLKILILIPIVAYSAPALSVAPIGKVVSKIGSSVTGKSSKSSKSPLLQLGRGSKFWMSGRRWQWPPTANRENPFYVREINLLKGSSEGHRISRKSIQKRINDEIDMKKEANNGEISRDDEIKIANKYRRILEKLTEYEQLTNAKIKHFYTRIRIKPLEEIYSGNYYFARPVEEIMEVAARKDRVIVGVVDFGVDYNHPSLAYKILRPDPKLIDEIGHKKVFDSIVKYRYRHSMVQEIKRIREEFPNVVGSRKTADMMESELAEAKDVVYRTAMGWDFVVEDHLPFDIAIYGRTGRPVSHGTEVTGVITSGTDDLVIVPVKKSEAMLLNDSAEFAIAKGARIINLSSGFGELKSYKHIRNHMSGALSEYHFIKSNPDTLFVVAAGNFSRDLADNPFYPVVFDLPNLLAVTSVDASNRLSSFSNYGIAAHIAAPGEDVLSATPGVGMQMVKNGAGQVVLDSRAIKPDAHAVGSGTSASAPIVTRVAGKILAVNPDLTPPQVISIIRDSATKVDALKGKVKFSGVVNERRALELAKKSLEEGI